MKSIKHEIHNSLMNIKVDIILTSFETHIGINRLLDVDDFHAIDCSRPNDELLFDFIGTFPRNKIFV